MKRLLEESHKVFTTCLISHVTMITLREAKDTNPTIHNNAQYMAVYNSTVQLVVEY